MMFRMGTSGASNPEPEFAPEFRTRTSSGSGFFKAQRERPQLENFQKALRVWQDASAGERGRALLWLREFLSSGNERAEVGISRLSPVLESAGELARLLVDIGDGRAPADNWVTELRSSIDRRVGVSLFVPAEVGEPPPNAGGSLESSSPEGKPLQSPGREDVVPGYERLRVLLDVLGSMRDTPPAQHAPDPERGELADLQCQVRSARRNGAPWTSAQSKVDALIRKNEKRWTAEFRKHFDVVEVRFHAGKIAEVELDARRFCEQAEGFARYAPDVRHVALRNSKGLLAEVLEHPACSRLHSLSLEDNRLADEDMSRLFETRELRELLWLSLAFNDLGDATLEGLACSNNLPSLSLLRFAGNRVPDPTDEVARDPLDGAELASIPTALGRKLERLAKRRLPWLHPSSRYGQLRPILPIDLW
jgi:hypothetical protein